MDTPTNRLLRPREAQTVLGLSRSAVYAAIASGAVPSIRIGRSVRIPADALAEWVARNTRPGTAPDEAA
jgi:excisionase family DNA binding protein